jgi:serine/threonine protein kinase
MRAHNRVAEKTLQHAVVLHIPFPSLPCILDVHYIGHGLTLPLSSHLSPSFPPTYLARAMQLEAIYKWTWQIASGLDCIHRAGMIHLDMKSSNILISNELNAVICDFGNTCDCR